MFDDPDSSSFADIRRASLLDLASVSSAYAHDVVLDGIEVVSASVDGVGVQVGVRNEFGIVVGLDVCLFVFDFIDAGMSTLAALVSHDLII